MNWPGVCNINSSLNVRASFFFVFFYTSCSHLQCHAMRHSIHLVSPFCFVLFFAVRGSSEGYLHFFFFHRHCFAGFVQRQPTGRVRLWESLGSHSSLQRPDLVGCIPDSNCPRPPPSFCSPRLLDATRLNGRADHLLFPPPSIFKKKNKKEA